MIKVYRSAIIDASADAVWKLVRDFNGLPKWHPAIATSKIEDGLSADRVGCVRRFTRKSDGGLLREKLLSLADDTRMLTYNILVSPMPVANYMAGMRFTPVTMDDSTFAEWWAVFDVTTGPPQATADEIGDNVFVVGFAAIDRLLARRGGLHD
ncbi:MAG: SRPBCC family protein [Burkholderiales bacterium]